MTDPGFLAALVPVHGEIMGYKLRPYCTGYALLLEAIKSPFFFTNRPITPRDIVCFLRVCSAPDPLDPDLRPSIYDRFRLLLLCNRGRLKSVAAACVKYLEAHANYPAFWKGEDLGGGGVTAPALLARIASMLTHTTLTLSELLSQRIDLLCWIDAAVKEQNGVALRFKDKQEFGEIEADLERFEKERIE